MNGHGDEPLGQDVIDGRFQHQMLTFEVIGYELVGLDLLGQIGRLQEWQLHFGEQICQGAESLLFVELDPFH